MAEGEGRLWTAGVVYLDLAVDDDGPGVELLVVVHDDGAGLLDDGKHHDGAECPPHPHGEMLEGLQPLGKL